MLRDAMKAWPMPSCGVRPLVHSSIHPSSDIVSKQVGYSYPQTFFTIGSPNHSSFCIPNVMAVLRL